MNRSPHFRSYYITGLLLFLVITACTSVSKMVTFPYSQWTVGKFGQNVIWKYESQIECNNSFIARPVNDEWSYWYKEILDYRKITREEIGKKTPDLIVHLSPTESSRLHFNKIGFNLGLLPGEMCIVQGSFRNPTIPAMVYVDFIRKKKGEESGYIDRGTIENVDSLEIPSSENWESKILKIRVPAFNPDSFALSPVLRFESLAHAGGDFSVKDVRLSVPYTSPRNKLLTRIEKGLQQQEADHVLKIPEELSWTDKNFVMGFVFMWDQDFWDPVQGQYRVDRYCNKMLREFGGFGSVILWQAYPNIGIDEKNQFDFYRAMPGGLPALKTVVDDFHTRNVKVFMTYNPWDLSTRRPENTDAEEIAQLIDSCKFDGIFLDTWSSAAGVVSLFSVKEFLREAIEKTGNSVAFETEMTPEYKDLIGYNAVTGSWGQEIYPYHFTDLSLIKWIFPAHIQHFISRANTSRRRELAHAWINGQGIQVWENLFGDMNLWNAVDRQTLRKMNAIWRSYGEFYLSDNWKPFMPTGSQSVQMSAWESGDTKIWNLVDESDEGIHTVHLPADPDMSYFDLWNGTVLKPFRYTGKSTLDLTVNKFSCVLGIPKSAGIPEKLLSLQRKESESTLPDPGHDPHTNEMSLKYPVSAPDVIASSGGTEAEMLNVKGGRYTFKLSHLNREGRCYPNAGAKNNHDLLMINENGVESILHNHEEQIQTFNIMPTVVTNAEFEDFLGATHYKPRFTENFLKHWGGSVCPDSLKNSPVVFVSLEDARAYAAWSGKRLPTEWEWQAAAQQYGDNFKRNEVWEWNESERNDGFNRFVTLRGGCGRWVMSSSWWYLPGASNGNAVGGPQPIDSHCKYFLMYPGLDRASTIGFRCITVLK